MLLELEMASRRGFEPLTYGLAIHTTVFTATQVFVVWTIPSPYSSTA